MSNNSHVYGHEHRSGGGTTATSSSSSGDGRHFAEISKNFNEFLRMFLLHRWAFLIPFCLVSGGAFILSLYYPRTYWAGTTFERRNDPILADLEMSRGAAMFSLFSTTIARDLRSLACMSEVVDRIGLTKDLPRDADGEFTQSALARRKALARRLGHRISLSTSHPNEEVDIIKITYTGTDPTIGRKLLDEVKAVYIRRTMDWVQQHLDGLREYYSTEKEDALKELRFAEREQTRLHLENPYLNPQNPGAIPAKLLQLEMESNDLLRRRREHQADLDTYKQILAAIDPDTALAQAEADSEGAPLYVSPEARHLQDLVDTIEQKIKTLKTSRGMTDRHPNVQELMATRRWRTIDLEAQRVRDRESALHGGPVDGAGLPVGAGAQSDPQPLRSEQARLQIQIHAKESNVRDIDLSLDFNKQETARLSEAKGTIFALQEEYSDNGAQITRAKHRHSAQVSMLSKIEPAIRVNKQGKLLHWSIGEPARGRARPTDPKAQTVMLLALLTGVIAGVVFVVLAEILDHVYRSADQVSQSLGVPMLAAIDEIVTTSVRRHHLIRRVVVAPIVLTVCLGFAGLSGSMAYFSLQEPSTYRKLRKIPQAALDLVVSRRPSESSSNSTMPNS